MTATPPLPGAAPEGATLTGLRVLLVEDNFLVGLDIRNRLAQFGCDVIGPVASADRAYSAIADDRPDVAVLDINILGGTALPVAEELRRLDVPFIFLSGYGSPSALPASMLEVRLLHKPVDDDELRLALAEMRDG